MVAIESSKLFGGLSQGDLDLLRGSMEVREFPHDQAIFKEGGAGDGMYMVRSGAVQISAVIGEGERKALANLGPGDYFGEMAVIDNEPRSASAMTQGETSVYYWPRGAILKLLEQSPILAVRLIREFSHRMREFNKRFVDEALQAERLTMVGRFARSIVHDFKNPLNVIGLAAEMAAMDRATPAMRTNSVARIRKQVDRLSRMTNELLEFTRGSQNPIVLAQTNFADFINEILEELSAEALDRRVEIVCETPAPEIELLLDPSRLTHVFYNLVHNAIQAMPDGGKIMLRFRSDNGELITEIEDTGKGFAPEIVNRLFEAFATFGKANGSGLGLAICKKIVTDHKGNIKAHNFPNRGAVFTIGLPLPSA
jgi:signal transduction histidine kinase